MSKIGERSELRVVAALRVEGVVVSVPWGEDQAYDLVADFDGELRTVQVKTAKLIRKGRVLKIKTGRTDRAGTGTRRTYREEVDMIGGNKAGEDRFYERYVPVADRLYREHLTEIREESDG